MKTRIASMKMVTSVVALLLVGTTIAAVSQREEPAVTRVPICVKENGQLRMLTGNNTACEPSERQMEWVVGGEVTEIQLGDGLVGGREDGAVRLALDPSIIAGCTGCRGGRVFAGFNDGPSMFPHNLLFETIAELNLPASDYGAIQYATCISGLGQDTGLDLAVDPAGCVYVTGFTESYNYRTVNAFQPLFAGGTPVPSDAFVTKLCSGLDHFKCYEVDSNAKVAPFDVVLRDQVLKRANLICIPSLKAHVGTNQ